MPNELVLVTGATGYVAQYVIGELLRESFKVRCTVRNRERIAEVLIALKNLGIENPDELTFVEADLTNDKGWSEAITEVNYVMHIASPFPSGPSPLEELMPAALNGTLRILKMSVHSKVKRIILTSSFAAIGYGNKKKDAYTEEDWTDGTDVTLSGYVRSKALAEKAAWDWMKENGGSTELTVVNPVGIFGPVLGRHFSASLGLIETIFAGKMPFSPHLEFGIVDVRDLAKLELLLLKHPKAVNCRFIACGDGIWTFASISHLLRKNLGKPAAKAVTREIPDIIAIIMSKLFPNLGINASEVGQKKLISNIRAKKLGWSPRSGEETIIDTAYSLYISTKR